MTVSDNDFRAFLSEARQLIPSDRITTDPLRLFAYGTDASFYRLVPKVVIDVIDAAEVQALLSKANGLGVPITFRAAGTSLSGQSISDSVLLRLSRDWCGHEIVDDGEYIRLQPAVVGGRANSVLAPLNRRIGPDPASINTAMIGGIVANNASGMCCGTAHNSYHTLKTMKLILADGTSLDTGNELSCDLFGQSHSELLANLSALADSVKNSPSLSSLIERKYRIKNTMGYALNALIDFDNPIEILQHLLVGSEGTLGFVADVTLRTIVHEPHRATGLYLFNTVFDACNVVVALKRQAVSAVELIDHAGLYAVADDSGIAPQISQLPSTACALLIEVSADTKDLCKAHQRCAERELSDCVQEASIPFTTDEFAASSLWALRKGLFPAVGAVRESGTTVVIEDVAFPIEHLAEAVDSLQKLLRKHNYHEAVLFGHALEGNLHFVFTQSFESESQVSRYRRFMADLAELVAHKYRGSLKAEHGTGRNMAPFVEMEWGTEAYQLMRHIKQLLDPNGILNPGVLLNDDLDAHTRHLKSLPTTEPLIDRCIECGFCEPSCPSKNITLTPRQRITVWREIVRLRAESSLSKVEKKQLAALESAYEVDGNDSCAACGLCEVACPVNVNVGDLTRSIRAVDNRPWLWMASAVSNHLGVIIRSARFFIKLIDRTANLVGRNRLAAVAKTVHRLSFGRVPLWFSSVSSPMTPSSTKQPDDQRHLQETVVYLPACPGKLLDGNLPNVISTVLARAGFSVVIPDNVEDECCGMPFASKGFADLADAKATKALNRLNVLGGDRKTPVICDASPCSQQLNGLQQTNIEVFDAVEFLHDRVLPRLNIRKRPKTVAIHTTCSSARMGHTGKMQALAEACCEEVIVPFSVSCCGFAGDKGFTLPSLNVSALKSLKGELPEHCLEGYSSSRTCEVGLTEHSGIPYQHVAYLLLESSL